MYVISHRRWKRRGLGDLSTVASTIQTIEGWFPGSVSYRNNNPGNLKCAGQPLAIGCDSNNFAIFSNYADGLQSENAQIQLDASRGLTIQQFINKYAPASDSNNPTSYAAKLAAASGLSVNDPLSSAIAEGSVPLDMSSSAGTSSGIDFSDPTTLVIIEGVGLLALYVLFAG